MALRQKKDDRRIVDALQDTQPNRERTTFGNLVTVIAYYVSNSGTCELLSLSLDVHTLILQNFMLRTRCHVPVRAILRTRHSRLSSGLNLASHHPNAPLDIDPAFKALLKDVDISLLHHKSRHHHAEDTRPKLRELEVYPEQDLVSEVVPNDEESESRMSRKSPAAIFGSQSIGAVIIPDELRESVQTLISGESESRLFEP